MSRFHLDATPWLLSTLLLACGGTAQTSSNDAMGGRGGGGGPSQDGARPEAAVASTSGTGPSTVTGSGGAVGADASKDWAPPVVSSGSIVDPRDGTAYKTVTINGLTWMAENLRYIPNDKAISDGAIRCGSKQFDYCATYGAYYSVGTTNPCPPDWRLPTKVEFQALFYAHAIDPVEAATKLRDTSWNGTNDYGFSALPAGYYDSTYAVSTITHARVPMYADNLLMAGFLTSSTKSAGYSYQTAARIFDAEYASGLELYDWSMNSLVMAFNARCVQ